MPGNQLMGLNSKGRELLNGNIYIYIFVTVAKELQNCKMFLWSDEMLVRLNNIQASEIVRASLSFAIYRERFLYIILY